MERRNLTLLLLIVVFGAVLRFSYLIFNPPSLNWDEVSHGYNAYSILKTGMDQWGQKFPIFNFRAYGDYPTTLNLYLTIPFIAALGLNEFSIRLPHVILGILSIISVYFLVLGLTKKNGVSLLAAFLVAIGPWYVFTSRLAIQANLSIFLVILSLALFFNRDKNKWFIPLSFLGLFLSLFAYHTTRIFSPLTLAALLFIYRKEFRNSLKTNGLIFFLAIFIILAFFASLVFISIQPETRARSKFTFLINEGAIGKIIQARQSSNLPLVFGRLIYNRPLYFVEEFAKNYFDYFSPKFLFFKGGTQYQFSVPKKGLLFPAALPFFYIGIFIIIRKAFGKDTDARLILVWLVLAPIPASVTNEKFAVLRSSTLLPLPEILVSLGFFSAVAFLEKVGRKKIKIYLLLIFLAALGFSLKNYLANYFTSYRVNYSWAWQYGYKEVVKYAKDKYNDYDKIIVTKKYGEAHEYFLFFWPWNPDKYQNDPNAIRFSQSNWYWIDRFDKFYFVNDWQIPRALDQDFVLESGGDVGCMKSDVRCLLITSPENFPSGWKKLDTINFLDGKPAFEIYEN